MTNGKGVVEMMRLAIVRGGHMRAIVEMTKLNNMQGSVTRRAMRLVMEMNEKKELE